MGKRNCRTSVQIHNLELSQKQLARAPLLQAFASTKQNMPRGYGVNGETMAHTKQNLPRGYGVNRETMAHSKQHLPRATCEWADFGPYQAELTKGLRCEWGDWSTLSRTYQKATL